MKAVGLLLPALLALAPATYAAPASQPAHISVRYQGNLRDALEKIAAEGNINLVAVGNLDIPAQVMLHDVTPEQAIDTIAKAYHLTLNKEGSIWTVAAPGALGSAPTAAPAPQAPAAPQAQPAPAPQAKSDEDKDNDESMEEKDSDEEESDEAQVTPPPPGVPGVPQPPHAPRMHPGGNDLVGTGPQMVAEDQTVDSAVAYGGNLKVDGHVTGDAVAFGGNVLLGPKARVDGDVVAFGGSVNRLNGSRVGGEVVNFGGRGMGSVAAQALTHGMVFHPGHHHEESAEEVEHHGMSRLAGLLLQFILYFGVGFLILMFAPGAMKKVSQEINRDPLRCGLTGFIALIALGVLSVLLCITVIGIIPLIPLLIVAMVAVAMGYTAVAQEIGMRIPAFRGRKTQALVLALGVLILLAVEVVPVVGPLTLSLLAFLGLGAVTRTRFGTRPKGFPEPA